MDQESMYKRFTEDRRYISREFIGRVVSFVEYACQQSASIDNDKIRCPCSNGENQAYHLPEDVKLHLGYHNPELSKVEEDGEVRVMTRGFGDLVAKLGDKVVMEVLVRCWSDGDVVKAQVCIPLANPIKDLKWSNVPWFNLSSLSKSDDTFLSLQALLDLYYLFDGFMDYFWKILPVTADGVSVSLGGEIFLGGKKYRESNIGDSDNTRDGCNIVGGAIGAFGGIEQFFQVQDYALWDVIENGISFKPVARITTNIHGTSTSTIPSLVTTEEKAQKKNDVKARSMWLMALPSEHLLTFSRYIDAKTLFEAIQARFGGNDATKKTQKTLLKQIKLAILGENISQEDLNLKFLRSLPAEWNTHVVVWRNKPDLDIMSFDDLYNNFKIVEQEVKRIVTSSSNSSSQNMAFVSSPSSTNEVNTANVQVSNASTPVTTASTYDNTANLSDATVYAFLDNQKNGSHLVHEDLEQIHEDDLEEMDLKWQLTLLSIRARRYYQRTGKKITINGSDTAGYDKSKVECFNYHKIGHFARECRSPRNQESRPRNQDNSRKTVNVEDTSPKAMVAIDGAGFDWSFMADEEVPTNMALMAFSDSKALNNKTCSNTCLKNYVTLKPQYDNLRIEFNKSEFDLATYKRGLASVEEQLVFYKKNEVMFYDQIAVLKRDASFKDSEINALNIQIEKLKKEKESN
ncbi:ribonuclease H-like domain-containing protein [Tanacetum coccineum]|uniref:Ribonuclease H-like domain-containing protein n=1 Tax=Tanacetum coccineum TaxID=301880 RepID=A0ABQ4WBW1_9ASTR